jgi:hypothetical protein
MQTRTCLPVQARFLIAAGLLACSVPSDPDKARQGEPARTSWQRAVGLIDNGGIAVDPLVVPDTVRSGVPFTAIVSTFGSSGCIRPDRSQVQGTGLQVDITPYDSVWSGSPPCLPGWEGYPRPVDLSFATPGSAVVRLQGRGFAGPLTLEKAVTVRP